MAGFWDSVVIGKKIFFKNEHICVLIHDLFLFIDLREREKKGKREKY